jgi:hypothetical protein
MAKQIVINLTTVRVDSVTILPLPLRVVVRYSVFDDQAVLYKTGEVTFWKEIPLENQSPAWLQLPSKYVSGLENMVVDALAALEAQEL